MNSSELREKFLKYFEGKGHKILPSASLVPENDPTVLFNVAGMQPLVRYLLGEKHESGDKLCNLQKCIRTIDIDEVGDASHLTFFEMMGYWSLGAYWKKEAINYIFEFLTKELGVEQKNMAVTCFLGEPDNNIPKDVESYEIWHSLGFPDERIAFLGRDDNWWGPAGETGPCGPDTEIFVWTGEGETPDKFDPTDSHWMEIGNNVFMQYNKTREGKYEFLEQRNVDFGAGYERIVSYIEGKSNVYETELFRPIFDLIEERSGKKYGADPGEIKAMRIVADHLKAAVFMIDDGVVPSNKERGYILRRLIRRAIVKASQLGITENFTTDVAKKVFEIYARVYFKGVVIPAKAGIQAATEFPGSQIDLPGRQAGPGMTKHILEELTKEETKFRKTLRLGLAKIEDWVTHSIDASKVIVSGDLIFDWYQSFGIPLDVSIEEVRRLGGSILDDAEQMFDKKLKEHQELSKTASAGMFKGGLAEAGEITTKYHTATHLLLAALRQVLGDHVYQKGSNITAERMRFDFSHPDKLTPEQIKEVEDIVNTKIEADLPVSMEEMSLEDAKNCGAMGVFESKYGEKVKVYTIGAPSTSDGRSGSRDFVSREICGGPHVAHTGELGHFKILKEESSSAGIRRVKAIIE